MLKNWNWYISYKNEKSATNLRLGKKENCFEEYKKLKGKRILLLASFFHILLDILLLAPSFFFLKERCPKY